MTPDQHHHTEHDTSGIPDLTGARAQAGASLSAWILGLIICALAVAFFFFPQTEPDRRLSSAQTVPPLNEIEDAVKNFHFLEQAMENPAGAGFKGEKPPER